MGLLASVTLIEKVVPVVMPESKPFCRGVQGSSKLDSVTECGMLEGNTKVTSVPTEALMLDGEYVSPLWPTCTKIWPAASVVAVVELAAADDDCVAELVGPGAGP